MNEQQPELSYFARRMAELGVTEQNNVIEIWRHDVEKDESVLKPLPVFRECERGIDILVYSLDQRLIKYTKDGSKWKKDYCITRLEHPIEKANGDTIKYLKPRGELSYPLFPPQLVQKYATKAKVTVLYLTEGFFKAFKADLHGIDCIGLQSITCLRDTSTNALWADIRKIIEECRVERVVWLTDGDYDAISSKELVDGVDLTKRANIFFSTVHTFYELTSQLDTERYFAHINTDKLPGNPKGLDDVLVAYPDKTQEIYTELTNFSIAAPNKVYPGTYITRINVSHNTIRVRKYFHLDDVTDFYLYHSERREEIRNLKNFCFYGTTYRYDEEEGKCVVEIPGDANRFIRIGNDFYKQILMPVKKDDSPIDKFKKVLSPRQKGTITDDYGKDFIKHIKKYEAPCIIPNHINYQQVVYNCYNLYHPFMHEAEEGDYSVTLSFLKHIFGEDLVTYTNPDTGITTEFPRYELGLDYFTIAYKRPWQMLPILCLVSPERQTGKTTFINFIDAIFGENAISIGNEDLEADFNAHWAGKLFIAVDETKVENGSTINKVKRLSTASELIMNAKGKDQVKLPFFAKFVLTSNHVENFIRIDKEEIRFWIHRIKRLENYNPFFLQQLIDEIPAFLHLLSTRKMATANEERHWFKTTLLETEALNLVKANSISSMEKRIRAELQDLFELAPELQEIGLPLKELVPMLKGGDKDYVRRTLQTDMGMKTVNGRFKYPKRREDYRGEPGSKAELVVSFDIVSGGPTSHYVFKRQDFITEPEEQPPAATDNSKHPDDLPF